MNRKITYSLITFSLLSLLCSLNQARTVISGIPDTTGELFPFSIGPHAYDAKGRCFYVGANEDISGKTDEEKAQAIGLVGSGNNSILAITPEKTKVNNVENQPNPLFGQMVTVLAMMGQDPLVVTAAKPNVLNVIRSAKSSSRCVLESDPITDATGVALSDGIVGASGGAILAEEREETDKNGQKVKIIISHPAFYIAVRPNGGQFGATNSAIIKGRVVRRAEQQKNNKEKVTFTLEFEAPSPLDVSTAGLKIGSDLAAINSTAVTMTGSVCVKDNTRLDAVYTGLQVTGGPNATDGARSILLKGIHTITPDAAIQEDSIVGGKGANIQVSTHHLATMLTSTTLDYLVVVGGVGAPAATAQHVYALPIVRTTGMLASKNSVIRTVVTGGESSTFSDREFITPATIAGDLFSPNDADIFKARVGGNGILPGDITEIFVEKDTVFAAVGSESANEKGGVFYSQAIFAANGRIMGWTDWRRTLGSTEKIFGLALDAKQGRFWFMPGADSNSLQTLVRNDWDEGQGFDRTIQDIFKDLKSGMQGLFDFDKTNSAFDQTPGNRISVLCATGFKRVALIQSGVDTGVQFNAVADLTKPFVSMDGTLAGFLPGADHIVMTGGVLDTIGPIVAADIVSDGAHSWLVVGGSGGLAVLANPDGTGWAQEMLQKDFNNLPATLAFKKIGSYQQVRKIIADNGKLYFVTTSQMVRIDASAAQFNGTIGNIGTELASLTTLSKSVAALSSFSDIAVSGKFALLATNAGLLRVGNGKDISTATGSNFVGWKLVVLPESAGPVTRLFVVSPTGNQHEFATDERGGNVYVLNAYVGYHQARIYRFAVNSVMGGGAISDTTFEPFNDFFIQDRKTFYLSRGRYRNYVVTDGALLFMSRSAYYPTGTQPFLEIENPLLRTGVLSVAQKSTPVVMLENGHRIGQIIHRSASGSWLVPGSQLRVGA